MWRKSRSHRNLKEWRSTVIDRDRVGAFSPCLHLHPLYITPPVAQGGRCVPSTPPFFLFMSGLNDGDVEADTPQDGDNGLQQGAKRESNRDPWTLSLCRMLADNESFSDG